jgi:hypothetical protein
MDLVHFACGCDIRRRIGFDRSEMHLLASRLEQTDGISAPVCNYGDSKTIGGQAFLNERGDPRLVLGDQSPRHGPSGSAGITAVNVAPRPGTLSSNTSPVQDWAE